MTLVRFNEIVSDQMAHCREVLKVKGDEYVFGTDRLEHFKSSGATQGISPEQALWGMVAKHLVSLSYMCQAENNFNDKVWREKITDTMNYMILLRALILEDDDNV